MRRAPLAASPPPARPPGERTPPPAAPPGLQTPRARCGGTSCVRSSISCRRSQRACRHWRARWRTWPRIDVERIRARQEGDRRAAADAERLAQLQQAPVPGVVAQAFLDPSQRFPAPPEDDAEHRHVAVVVGLARLQAQGVASQLDAVVLAPLAARDGDPEVGVEDARQGLLGTGLGGEAGEDLEAEPPVVGAAGDHRLAELDDEAVERMVGGPIERAGAVSGGHGHSPGVGRRGEPRRNRGAGGAVGRSASRFA